MSWFENRQKRGQNAFLPLVVTYQKKFVKFRLPLAKKTNENRRENSPQNRNFHFYNLVLLERRENNEMMSEKLNKKGKGITKQKFKISHR